ncbi:hypothetical protein KC678_03490 [Candidatus Dojkabacteria bacterium]|uniref:Uncharacterized protein n=1 Tax=Candidatus Dojkabacteria bacterium TaxID=2099670 RepID=A0A955L1S8_9BACT|nr:hypothetical protein [Candidatus Dojkabacteria bacterium]
MTISYDDDWEYAHAKLSDSVITFNNFPYYVKEVTPSCHVHLKKFYFGESVSANLNQLDLTPFSLGYYNSNDSCIYVKRVPQRNWKQGLRTNNIASNGGFVEFESEGFLNCLLDKYPSIDDCIEFISCQEYKAISFHKQFALGSKFKKGFNLLYKDKKVGYIDPEKTIFPVFDEHYIFLTELFEDIIHANNQGPL